ncbi:MAG: hypothetical protein HYZ14_13035 [Bacteroidetes bacterium]|nr:hypothetical protein [Bacteroidota bacterium]
MIPTRGSLSWTFLLFSALIVIFYTLQLIGKIENPHQKNLTYDEFMIAGVFVFLIVLADILVIIRMIRHSKKKQQ